VEGKVTVEEFEYRGYWWLPAAESQRVAGTLVHDPKEGSLELTLDGSFGSGLDDRSLPYYQTILGTTQLARNVTLCGCRSIGRTTRGSSQEAIEEKYLIGFGVLGAHFSEGEQAKFSRVRLDFTHLNEWAYIDPLTRDETQTTSDVGTSVSMSYWFPRPLKAELDFGSLSVAYGHTESMGNHERIVRRPVNLTIDFKEGKTFSGIMDSFIQPIQYLLTLACDAACQLVSFEAFNKDVYYGSGDERFLEPLDLVYTSSPNSGTQDKQHGFRMLFTLGEVQEEFPSILASWFQLFQEVKNALDLMFAVILGPRLFLETRFLLVVQAVEIFHRRRFFNQVRPRAEHRARLRRIRESLPPEFRDWLNQKLAYSNEPTLRQRLESMGEAVGEEGARLIDDRLAMRVADTRNYLTHYDPRLRGRAAEGEELYWLGVRLAVILQACLLQAIGIDQDRTWTLIRRTQRFKAFSGRTE
jgi:hypothetical protein